MISLVTPFESNSGGKGSQSGECWGIEVEGVNWGKHMYMVGREVRFLGISWDEVFGVVCKGNNIDEVEGIGKGHCQTTSIW